MGPSSFVRAGVATLAIGVLAAAASAQPTAPQQPPRDRRVPPARETPPEGTARITGAVLTVDGTPLRRARVFVRSTELPLGRAALTDDQGRFEVRQLPAGRYTVTVSKAGFVTMSYGQRRANEPGLPLRLEDAQGLERVDFRLPRGSIITGHLYDEGGEPLPGAIVRVMRQVYRDGERELVAAGFDRTDDRGEYRVFGLTPGDYYVSATVDERLGALQGFGGPGGGFRGPGGMFAGRALESDEGERSSYAPTFYPGLANPSEASRLSVGLAQELAGVDFAVQLVPSARISGTVIGPTGDVSAGVVMLSPDTQALAPPTRLRGRIRPDGTFTVRDVPPGRYLLVARVQDREADSVLTATASVGVNGVDLDGLTLAVTPGATMVGRVSIEALGASAPPDLARLLVTTRSVADDGLGRSPAASPSIDGRFTLRGIPLGTRVVQVARVPREWTIKSILVDGVDATDRPFEVGSVDRAPAIDIVLTDAVTQVGGTVRDATGQPLTDYMVIVFPADSRLWTPWSRAIAATRADQSGQFEFRGLPPGDYGIAVAGGVEDGQWTDPAFLDRLRPTAIPLALAQGDVKTQDLTIGAR